MKIFLGQIYKNADDTVAIDTITKQPITLRHMLEQALLASFSPNTPDSEKLVRFALWRRLKKFNSDTVSLKAEDIVLLKKAIMPFDTLVVGQTYEMLENEDVEVTEHQSV